MTRKYVRTEFVCLTGGKKPRGKLVGRSVDRFTLRGRFNSFTPFRQREFTRRVARDVRADGVCNTTRGNIFGSACSTDPPRRGSGFLKHVERHTRGIRAAAIVHQVDECYFRRTSHARPGVLLLAPPRPAAKRKA